MKDENGDLAIVTKDIEETLTEATWNDGARFWKYEVDKAKKYDWAENDYVLMRYADVLWMKEEAIKRGGMGTSGANTSDFKKMLKRAFAYEADPKAAYEAAYTTALTLDNILDERGREFYAEGCRRSDLIRFRKFGGNTGYQWELKGGSNRDFPAYMNLYPIPDKFMNMMYQAVQNEGY